MSDQSQTSSVVYILSDKWLPVGREFNFAEDIKKQTKYLFSPEYFMSYELAREEFKSFQEHAEASGLFIFMYRVRMDLGDHNGLLTLMFKEYANGTSLERMFNELLNQHVVIDNRWDPESPV